MPAPNKVNWWYERLVDWMLLNPERTLGDAAREFGVSQAWLSVIKNSDAFKTYYEARSAAFSAKMEAAGINSIAGVKEKMASAAETALDEINRRLETIGTVMPMKDLLSIARLDLAKQGYGLAGNVQVNVNTLTQSVDPAELAAAREKMKQISGVTPTALPRSTLLLEESGESPPVSFEGGL